MTCVFMSFGSVHSGKPLGCCIVRVPTPDQANDEVTRLGLMPQECNRAYGYLLPDEEFPKQGMELNRFYTAAEMRAMGFQKTGGSNE